MGTVTMATFFYFFDLIPTLSDFPALSDPPPSLPSLSLSSLARFSFKFLASVKLTDGHTGAGHNPQR
jgi:hypothetical protein